jgi:hypothetical protein
MLYGLIPEELSSCLGPYLINDHNLIPDGHRSPLMKGISYFSSISSKVQIPVGRCLLLSYMILMSYVIFEQVSELGKAIARVGITGSNGLPASAQATQAGAEGARFTVIANTGALNLAKQ